jgi:hypothetical protein
VVDGSGGSPPPRSGVEAAHQERVRRSVVGITEGRTAEQRLSLRLLQGWCTRRASAANAAQRRSHRERSRSHRHYLTSRGGTREVSTGRGAARATHSARVKSWSMRHTTEARADPRRPLACPLLLTPSWVARSLSRSAPPFGTAESGSLSLFSSTCLPSLCRIPGRTCLDRNGTIDSAQERRIDHDPAIPASARPAEGADPRRALP